MEKHRLCPEETVLIDGTANVGGVTIDFARSFKHVHAIEWDPLHVSMLRHNVDIYKLKNKVSVYQADANQLIGDIVERQDSKTLLFLDPPWGGRNYLQKKQIDLFLGRTNVIDLIDDPIIHLIFGKAPVISVGPTGVRALGALEDLLPRLDPIVVGAVDNLHDVLREPTQAVGEGAMEPRLPERFLHSDHDRGVTARWVVGTIVFGSNARPLFPDHLDRFLVRARNRVADNIQNRDVT